MLLDRSHTQKIFIFRLFRLLHSHKKKFLKVLLNYIYLSSHLHFVVRHFFLEVCVQDCFLGSQIILWLTKMSFLVKERRYSKVLSKLWILCLFCFSQAFLSHFQSVHFILTLICPKKKENILIHTCRKVQNIN